MVTKKRHEQVHEDAVKDPVRLNRRDFMKTSFALSSGLLMGSAGLSTVSGCGHASNWEGLSFPKIVLHNFELCDGVANRLQKDRIVLIKGDKIQAVENIGDLSQFNQYKVVDLNGLTLLPGLIDNHVHITVPFMHSVNFNSVTQMNQQIEYNFRNCIMNGVTTVRDVGGFPGKINKFRKMADDNQIPGPRVISSLSPIAARNGDRLGVPENAPYFTNPLIKWVIGGNYAERPTNVNEIKSACKEMVKSGAQWLKTFHQDHPYSYSARKLPNHIDEGYRTIIKIAREHGIKCALHEPLVTGFKKGVDLGFHTLEHMPMDAIIPSAYIEKFMQQEMAIMPTIMIYGDSFISNRLLHLMESKDEASLMPEAISQMSARLKKRVALEKSQLSKAEYDQLQFDNKYAKDMFPNVIANLKKLHKMGATIGAGSDIGGTATGFFGRFTDELRHYAAAGITNHTVLQMATTINARILGMQKTIGTIEKGKFADMIAVNGNPLLDIDSLDKTDMVIKGGVFIKQAGLNLV